MKNRSTYGLTVNFESRVFSLIDYDIGKSITNDAENVVEDLITSPDMYDMRIVYQDTAGDWAEILHKDGKFVGFSTNIKLGEIF